MQRQSTEESRKDKRWCGDEPRATTHKRQAKAMLRMETQYEKHKAKAKRRADTICAGEERQTYAQERKGKQPYSATLHTFVEQKLHKKPKDISC